MTNILITGYPRSGKTTLVINFVKKTKKNCTGFYTEEIRNEHGTRVGFKVVGIKTKKEGILSHIDEVSQYRVGKYKVTLESFEEIALLEMRKEADLIIIDEIGKMELLSEPFKKELIKCLDKGNVLATITMKGGGKFVNDIKNRPDVELITISPTNRDEVSKELIERYLK